MSISVADPDRLPSMYGDERDPKRKVKNPNSYKLPGQTWIQRIAKRPTVIKVVGTQTGTIYWSPEKQPPGLTIPPTTAELQKTCYSTPAGAVIPYVGEYWIIVNSATAHEVTEYDGSDALIALSMLGLQIVGGSSGLPADVRDFDANADVDSALRGLVTNSRESIWIPGAPGNWAVLTGDSYSGADGDAASAPNAADVIAMLMGRDISGGGAGVRKAVEARSLTGLSTAANTLIALLTGSALFGRLAGGGTIDAIDCDAITVWDGLATSTTRRLINSHALLSGRDTNLATIQQVGTRGNYSTLATMFGTNPSDVKGLVVNSRERWLDLCVEATGVSGAAVTLTLPAPGANLRQHISAIKIEKFNAAALVAAAAPVIVTSTNTVGTPSWNFSAAAEAQGVLSRVQEHFPHVVRADAANTAVTIVAPATTDVIWKITAWYYNA